MRESIWRENITLPHFLKLQENLACEVVVVGGGMAGLLIAWELTCAGADCVLLEADRICRGVSGDTTAKITSQHGLIYNKLIRKVDVQTAKSYYRVHQQALERYRILADRFLCDWEERDNYIYSAKSNVELGRELEALKRIGADAEFCKISDLPFPISGAIRFRKQAQFHPLKFAAGMAGDLKIYEHTPVREFGEGWVKTDGGTVSAGFVIVATHFPILNKHGGYFLKLYQLRSYVLALRNAGKVEGMYLDAGEKGLSLRMHGDLLLLGGGGHRTGKQGGGWRFLEEQAEKYFPQAEILCRWAAQDCMTLDGMPYIGRYGRNTEKLFVATGFNKWGMTSAMVSAMILSELVQGREHPWAKIFDPARTMLRPQLAVNTVESILNLLTPTVPRCPHLGCALKWNQHNGSVGIVDGASVGRR